MGANPLLGFGRIYARPEVARFLDEACGACSIDRAFGFAEFYAAAPCAPG